MAVMVYKAVYDPTRSTTSLYLVVAHVSIESIRIMGHKPTTNIHPLKKYYCQEDVLRAGTDAIYELPAATVLMRAQFECRPCHTISNGAGTADENDFLCEKTSAAVIFNACLARGRLPAWSSSLKSAKFVAASSKMMIAKKNKATVVNSSPPSLHHYGYLVGVSLTPWMAIRRKLSKKYIESASPQCLFSKSVSGGYSGPYYVYADNGDLLVHGAYKFGLCDGTWNYVALGVVVEFKWDVELGLQEAFRTGDTDAAVQLIHSKWDDCYGLLQQQQQQQRKY